MIQTLMLTRMQMQTLIDLLMLTLIQTLKLTLTRTITRMSIMIQMLMLIQK